MDLDIRREELEGMSAEELAALMRVHGLLAASVDEILEFEEELYRMEQEFDALDAPRLDWDELVEELQERDEEELDALRIELEMPGAGVEELAEEIWDTEMAMERRMREEAEEDGPGTEGWRLRMMG